MVEPSAEGDVELVEPRKGTVPWLLAQPQVELDGWQVPAVHRIPEGATIRRGEDDGRCRVIRADGSRCRAVRTRLLGICSAHAGGGDSMAGALASGAARARMRSRRLLLGVGPAGVSNPRQMARLRSLERADELAQALVDAPLDDPNLSSIERQQAVVRALGETFPLQQMTVEVELPSSAAGVAELGWSELQQLASRVMGQEVAGELEPPD